MIDTTEVTQTVEHLSRTFEDLILRGLKTAGPNEINTLTNIKEECDRIGAAHLGERVGAIIDAIRTGDRKSAGALMRAQASLRMFDRILTLEHARSMLEIGQPFASGTAGDASAADAPDGDENDEEDDEVD